MKILVSMFNVAGYGGAATVVLELAEEFIQRGHEVDLCAWWMANPMATHFKQAGVRRREDIHDTNPFDYDIVLFLHHSAPLHFSKCEPGGVERTLVLFFRLSHSSNIGVPSPILEDIIADKWFVNSEEVRLRLEKSFGVPTDKFVVFSNAMPSQFAKAARGELRPLKHVIYVSNHNNLEIRQALELLRNQYGIRTTHYGSFGDRQVRITPREILEADVVITMAKTAQYAIVSRTPVYVYDHRWGGPGYLNADNFQVAAAHNFSGSYDKNVRTPEAIANEIVSGYPCAGRFAMSMPQQILDSLSLEKTVQEIFDLVDSAGSNHARLERMKEATCLLNRERAYVESNRLHFRRERQAAKPTSEVDADSEKLGITELKFAGVRSLIIGYRGEYIWERIRSTQTFYEQPMLEFIQRLGLGGTYVDIGANLGNHCVFFARHCACTKVLAFEPFAPCFELLQHNIRLNVLSCAGSPLATCFGGYDRHVYDASRFVIESRQESETDRSQRVCRPIRRYRGCEPRCPPAKN